MPMDSASQGPLVQPQDKIMLDSLEALKVYFDPLRMKIVQEVAGEPKTVHDIADSLNVPFTRLYYHINMLTKHNIIRVVETRSMSGAVEEKYYQVTARMFVVARSLLTVVDEERESGLDVLLSSILDETKTDIRRSVQSGLVDMEQESPHADALLLRRGFLRLSRQQAQDFHQDLIDLVLRYQNKPLPADDSGRDYALALAIYPSEYGSSRPMDSHRDNEFNDAS